MPETWNGEPITDADVRKRLERPARGSGVLTREREQTEALEHELAVKKAVKRRDGTCRWPESHKCRGGLECAHIVDASLGGPMEESNLILVCAWIHRRGPESIHGKQLRIERDDDRTLSFWKKGADGAYFLIVRRHHDGTVEHD